MFMEMKSCQRGLARHWPQRGRDASAACGIHPPPGSRNGYVCYAAKAGQCCFIKWDGILIVFFMHNRTGGKMDNQGPMDEGVSSQLDVYVKLLEQSNENIRSVYSNLTQWAALLSAAWALITGFGFQTESRSAFLVFLGGVVLIFISYLLSRAGIGLGALSITAMIYEKKLGIQNNQSYIIGTLLPFRGRRFTKKIMGFCESGNEFDWFESVERYSDYNIFHITHSKTSLFVVIIGTFQCVLAVFLFITGRFPFIS